MIAELPPAPRPAASPPPASAGITLAVAGCMTGADLARIEQLPDTPRPEADEVLIQTGHMVYYGAPVEQAIRLDRRQGRAGRHRDLRPRPITSTGAISRAHGGGGLRRLASRRAVSARSRWPSSAAICRARGVPVIVDAASEYDLQGFLAAGADIVVYSAHKFLGGPTAGIVAGRKDLVRAAFLQNGGIGRGMKVGKESIAGTIAALEAWAQRDHAAVRARERGHPGALAGAPGRLPGAGRDHRARSDRQPARPAEAAGRSRGKPAPRPGRSPPRWPPASRRSSCATTRSSTATSISIPATCIPARPRSSPRPIAARWGDPRPAVADARGAARAGASAAAGLARLMAPLLSHPAHRQALRRHHGAAGCQLRGPCRRGGGPAGRQRCRQVHPGEDHRRRPARPMRASSWSRGPGGRLRQPGRRQGRRDRDGLSGLVDLPEHGCGRQLLHGPRARAQHSRAQGCCASGRCAPETERTPARHRHAHPFGADAPSTRI